MSSRVLTGTKIAIAQPLYFSTALGVPVNVNAEERTPGSTSQFDPASVAIAEYEGALQRIQVLERRIQELESELPRRYESGRQAGLAEGEASGSQTARAEWKPAMERLARTLADLASYPATFRRDAEPELLRLSMAIARKILRRELQMDPHSLLGVIKAALETLNASEVLHIRLAPDDVALLQSQLKEIGLPQAVEVVPDRTLPRGSILVQTKRGMVDASIQTQLNEIESGFADRLAAGRGKS